MPQQKKSKKRQKWSKELIIARLQERARKGLSISSADLVREDLRLYRACCYYFVTYENAIEAAGFSYDVTRKREAWTPELIITRLQERVEKGLSISVKDIKDEDGRLYMAIHNRRYFHSHKSAIEAAGFSYNTIRKNSVWGRKGVIARICERVKCGLSISSYDIQQEDKQLYSIACYYFGDYKSAIVASGFSYDAVRKNCAWTKELVVKLIRARYRSGLSISDSDVNHENPSLYGACHTHFVTYENAVEAAGFSYDAIRKCETWTPELVLARLKERVKNGLSISSRDMQREDLSLYGACLRHFLNSYESAVEAAGFSYDTVIKSWSARRRLPHLNRTQVKKKQLKPPTH